MGGAPSGPAPIAPSGPDQREIALSLVALLYKAGSSATPAVRMVPGRSARILGVICSLFAQQLKGSTRVPPGFHQGSTCCWGYHLSLFLGSESLGTLLPKPATVTEKSASLAIYSSPLGRRLAGRRPSPTRRCADAERREEMGRGRLAVPACSKLPSALLPFFSLCLGRVPL